MKREELDRSFGETPRVFTDRIDDVLRDLKEEPPVRKFTLRTVAVAMVIALTVCGVAYAVVAMQGQEWYYTNRFTAYQEHEPAKQQAILDNLQTDVPQEETKDDAGLISVTVQDYAWAPEQSLFTLSLAARPTDDKTYELHPMQSLDTDGAYGDDPDDPESHAEHYLWTEKGFGLPKDVMLDPTKQLLLIDNTAESGRSLTIGDTDAFFPECSMDAFDGEDGATIFVLEFDMKWIDDAYIGTQFATDVKEAPTDKTYTALHPMEDGESADTQDEATTKAIEALKDRLCILGYMDGYGEFVYDDATVQAVTAFQQMNGLTADGLAGTLTQEKLFADDAIGADGTTDAAVSWSPAGRAAQNAELLTAYQIQAQSTRDAIIQNTDENGMLTLCMNYSVAPFTDGEVGQAQSGKVTFQVKIK